MMTTDRAPESPAMVRPWWRRLFARIDAWLYETERLRDMDEDRPGWDS